ncbi:hypothetical protein ACWD3J_41750 [Streptomyces sp. NPDC002755]|uniref:hypothetical protein n=1 Tax=Streptomyces sp. NPDC002884 TaxID=3154544 RepID=UPI003320A127
MEVFTLCASMAQADASASRPLASVEATGWRSRRREEAVTLFEHLPPWSVERAL